MEMPKEESGSFVTNGKFANSPTGTFKPHADQKKYVSTFACVSGDKKGGWSDGHQMQEGVPTQDGKGAMTFDEFKDERGKPHDIKFNGMTLREFVANRDVAKKKEVYDANLSTEKVRNISQPVDIKSSPTTVGRQNTMELDSFLPASAIQ